MKNIQVIDGALNSAYDIFSCTDEEFQILFAQEGQNIEFIEDLAIRVEKTLLNKVLTSLWKRPVRKHEASGIHGTLFYELQDKKGFYPNKKESDLDRDRGWNHG